MFYEVARSAIVDFWASSGQHVDHDPDAPILEIENAPRIGTLETESANGPPVPAPSAIGSGPSLEHTVSSGEEAPLGASPSVNRVPDLSPGRNARSVSNIAPDRLIEDTDAATLYFRVGGGIALVLFFVLAIAWLGIPPHTTTTYEVAANGTMTQSTSPGTFQILILLVVALASAGMFKLASRLDRKR